MSVMPNGQGSVMALELLHGADGQPRCGWCGSDALYQAYHDHEWGMPVDDDRRLFEKLCLESFQAGLSWRTILGRRDGFRAAFHDFDWIEMARMGDADVLRLLQDPGIIRHRGKIEAVLHNARCMQELLAREGSLAAFVWSFEPDPASRPAAVTVPWLCANTTSPASEAMARELRRRGWRFLGPTTVHAFMQSMGLINDHLDGCHVRARVTQARASFRPPTARSS